MLSDDYAWWRLELHLCSVAMTTGVLACELALWGGRHDPQTSFHWDKVSLFRGYGRMNLVLKEGQVLKA
ncbi:hypothetical protein VitviT2T_022931 [Vitis vinifera]|uniref:Uncharacterized protein n=1 Tax=Vitis vinifera TaxID=29760 RepID=A0ABY9DBB5_VITVI|nr:hypothetical protein VitviT2T_022931 [Vitis vinifera]